MKKLRYGLFPILLVISFFLGRQAQHFLGRVQDKSIPAREPLLLEEVSIDFLKTEKGAEQLTSFFAAVDTISEPLSHEKEIKIMRRLRILQKMAAENVREPNSHWLPVLQKILENQNEAWVVQRQALKNIQPYWQQFSEKQRDLLLSKIDLRAKTTWHMSDREFVQLFESIP